LTLAIHSPERV